MVVLPAILANAGRVALDVAVVHAPSCRTAALNSSTRSVVAPDQVGCLDRRHGARGTAGLEGPFEITP